jgi:integrase/recombinase XerD
MEIVLAKIAAEFLDRPELATSTIRSYESALIPLLEKYGRFPIAVISLQDITEYFDRLTDIASSTYNRHQSIIKALFNFAFDRGYLECNPLNRQFHEYVYSRSDSINTQEKDCAIRYLNSKQLNLVYSSIEKNSRLHLLILFLHHTGIKTTEALALNLDDLNLGEKRFKVVNSFDKQRWCVYGEELAMVLDRYLRFYHHQGHLALFTAKHPTTHTVSRLSYRSAHRDWMNFTCKIADLQGLRLQDLRHTFIVERIGTVDLTELQMILGYKSIQGLLRYQKAIKLV